MKMEIKSLMSSQLMVHQQTVQLNLMQNALNLNTSAAIELLNSKKPLHNLTEWL